MKGFNVLSGENYIVFQVPGKDRKAKGEGVKTGFWHIMEVLSLPWTEALFWPNTTEFKTAKRMLERELDNMYIQNSSLIFGHKEQSQYQTHCRVQAVAKWTA